MFQEQKVEQVILESSCVYFIPLPMATDCLDLLTLPSSTVPSHRMHFAGCDLFAHLQKEGWL